MELRAQLTHCQNEKHQMKEEVKNLTEVKGRFLAMKEESNNTLAVAKRADDLLDLLSKHNEEKGDKSLNCENILGKLEAKILESLLNITQMIREHEKCSFKYAVCSDELFRCRIDDDELRKNISMLESENDKLTKNYTQCSERLTTCEQSCQLYSFLYSRKCFKVMLGNIELICQPIFVM